MTWKDYLEYYIANHELDNFPSVEELMHVCTSMGIEKFKMLDVGFGENIAHLHSEVSELYDEMKDGNLHTYWKKAKPEGAAIEAADVMIKLLAICGAYDIDIIPALAVKLLHNATKKDK